MDELYQVEIPINESGYQILSNLDSQTTFSDEEMAFLDPLIRMSFITRRELLERALAIARAFKSIPKGRYRSALL